MSEAVQGISAEFCVGDRVSVAIEARTPLFDEVRARRGDTGEVVHVLDSLTPVGVVVRLDKPGAGRIIVAGDMIELVGRAQSASETAEVVAAAEAIAREAGEAFLEA